MNVYSPKVGLEIGRALHEFAVQVHYREMTVDADLFIALQVLLLGVS